MLRSANGWPHSRRRGSNLTEFREFQDGELIAGTRYRVLSLIGVGGMGSVYEVEHTELGKRFVLKALLRELSRRDDLAQRMRNEWRALARLQHANIVNVTDAGTSDGGVPFYVMEHLDGDTLAALLRRKRRLHVLEAVHVAVSVLEALSAAHEIGIIHRDVKPANVFIAHGGKVKLLDFGIAKIANSTGVVTARGLAVGTPRYMSPEQARGERVDGRSDVYATGLILFEMIAGVGPFDDVRDANELLLAHMAREAPPLSSLVNGVSPELELILTNLLAKDCRQRPAHARRAAEQLRDFAVHQRSLPATDAPTEKADYGAPTVPAQRKPGPGNAIHESITRPESPLRKRLARDASASEELPTQRISLRPETTQVTLSARTGESFSVSSVPNTTFVSPPSFDGSTTVKMATVRTRTPSSVRPANEPLIERPERTEMLSEVPPAEPPDTRTQVPLPERTRPLSVTPPPVVDTGRAEGLGVPRSQLTRRWIAGVALGVSVLVVAGVALRRAALPGERTTEAIAAAQPVALKGVASDDVLVAPQSGGSATAPVAPPAPLTTPTAASAPALAASGYPATPPAASGSARNSRMIFDAKRLSRPSLPARSPAPGSTLPGPIRSSISPRPRGPELPGSGL